MPLQPFQRDWLIQQQGFDPSQYTLSDDESEIIPKPTNLQPALNPTPYQPKVEPQPKPGAVSAGITSFEENAFPSLISGVGAGTALTGIGTILDATGVGAPVGIPLQILGTMAAGYGANRLARQVQRNFQSPQFQQEVAQGQAEHPIASTIGQLATLPLAGMNPSPGNVVNAARAIPKILQGQSATADELSALLNTGIGAGLGVAQPLAESAVSGQPLPSARDLLLSAATGAVFSKPNPLGRMMGFHGGENVPNEPTADMLARIREQGNEGQQLSATPGLNPNENLMAGQNVSQQTPGSRPKINDEGDIEWQGKTYKMTDSGLLRLAEDSNGMWNFKQGPENLSTELEQGNQAGEGNVQSEIQQDIAEERRNQQTEQEAQTARNNIQQANLARQQRELQIRQNQLEEDIANINQQQASSLTQPEVRPETGGQAFTQRVTKANRQVELQSPADLEARQLEARLSGQQKPKYQEQSNIATPEEQNVAAELKAQGLSGKLTQKWLTMAQKIGLLRNIAIQEDGTIINTDNNKPVAGQTLARQGLQEVISKINPKLAGADTPYHEEFHSYINDLRQSPRARDRAIVEKYDALTKTNPDYLAWKTKRDNAGLESGVEEYQATNAGAESIRRAIANESPWRKWWNDLSSYSKTRFGENGTMEDFQRILHYKLLHDPSFEKVFGKQNRLSVAGLPSTLQTANQEESNIKSTEKVEYTPEDKAEHERLGAEIQRLTKEKQWDKIPEVWQQFENVRNKYKGAAPKNQEQSNFNPEEEQKRLAEETGESSKENPKSLQVRTLLNNAFDRSDDATIKPENADEIHDILKNQVDWPVNSKVAKELNRKDFDTLDPEHWKSVLDEYNKEQFLYPSEVQQEANKNPATAQQQTKPVEVPREVSSTSEVETAPKVQHRTQKEKVEKGPAFTPGEKVSSLIPGGDIGKPSSALESKMSKKKVLSPEELQAERKSVEASWKAIDEVKTPEQAKGMMATLEAQYQAATDRRNEARRQGDIDAQDKAVARQVGIRAQMSVLGGKFSIRQPELPSNQEGSAFANTAEDEPRLNFRVHEFSDDLEHHDLPYHSLGITRPLLDEVRRVGGESGDKLADSIQKYYTDKDSIYGRGIAPILNAAKGLSDSQIQKVENALIMENRRKTSYRDILDSKQQDLYDAVRDSLRQKQEEQIEAGQPVTDIDSKGNITHRLPQVDPYYYPNKINPQVAEILTERPNSRAARNLEQDFIEYHESMGNSPEQAQEKFNSIVEAYDTGEPNLTSFGAVRKAEGIGLPDSWMRPGLLKNMNSYFNRVSADRAFHDNIETNPEVAKSIGINEDAYGRPWDETTPEPEMDLEGVPEVKQVLDQIRGEPYDKDEAKLKLWSRIASSLFLGPLTNIHIAASSVAKSLDYLGHEAPAAITHALTNISDGYAKSLESGYSRKNLTRFRDILDINNTAQERLQAAANSISKINGRDLTNYVTKGFLQNIGEWIINSKLIAAEAGDEHAQDIIKRVDPDWTPDKEYTPEQIQDLGSQFASIIHGAHDSRTLPGWMLKDTAIQPFFQLMSWNVAQTNAWLRHVWTPATEGNLTPLIMSTLGSAVGGYLIKEAREKLGDKKSAMPGLQDIINSSRGVKGNIPALAYSLMGMSSYVGYAGILSTAAKAAGDLWFKNIPQAAAFPLDEVVSSLAYRPAQAISALLNDKSIQSPEDYINVGTKLATDLVKENIQFGRILTSWAARSPELMPTENYYKELNKKTSDLRRFKMVEGLPYEAQTASTGNPYMDLDEKKFKHSQDVGEAAQMIPGLIEDAVNKANGNYDVLRAELHKLKANSYETIPSWESAPQTFAKYMEFIRRRDGDEAANNLIADYLTHRAINEYKAKLIPSI